MKPERDPELCEWCEAPDEDAELVATPEGPLCQDHADELAAALEGEL